jgi:hypothetical protein
LDNVILKSLNKKSMANILTWLQNATASVGTFVTNEIAKIKGEAPVVEAALETAANIGYNAVNALKNYIASPVGKEIEDVILAIPGISPYAQQVLNFLPTLINDLGWAKSEFNKSPAQVVQEGVTAAINAASANVKATNLITLAAHINTLVASLAQAPISIQAAVSIAPAVYSTPSLVTPAKAA